MTWHGVVIDIDVEILPEKKEWMDEGRKKKFTPF